MSVIKRTGFHLSTDKALGVFGGGLAAASLGFGVYMNIHGPVEGFGTSHDFTVFAQFAPKRQPRPPRQASPAPVPDETLDMTSTASIPKAAHPRAAGSDGERRDAEAAVIPSVTLEAANPDVAMIAIDGRAQTVRVGDIVPGAGEVLEIHPGRHASVKTSRGLILSSRQD